MGGTSIWHWLVVGVIVLLLFGRGKISEMMGDVAKGIKAFKKGMSEDEAVAFFFKHRATTETVRTIEHHGGQPAAATPAGASTTLGDLDLLQVAVQGLEKPLQALVRNLMKAEVGQDVGIDINPEEVLVFAAGDP